MRANRYKRSKAEILKRWPIYLHVDTNGRLFVYSWTIVQLADEEGWVDAPVIPCRNCFPDGLKGVNLHGTYCPDEDPNRPIEDETEETEDDPP